MTGKLLTEAGQGSDKVGLITSHTPHSIQVLFDYFSYTTFHTSTVWLLLIHHIPYRYCLITSHIPHSIQVLFDYFSYTTFHTDTVSLLLIHHIPYRYCLLIHHIPYRYCLLIHHIPYRYCFINIINGNLLFYTIRYSHLFSCGRDMNNELSLP